MNLFLEFIHEHILAIDFAIFVLIWLVQLVIYPSFVLITDSLFNSWHTKYCKIISYFVLPLMTAQLFESLASCFFINDLLSWLKACLVISIWVFTFFVSAKYHGILSSRGKNDLILRKLVKTNWYRTIFWSVILVISYIQY